MLSIFHILYSTLFYSIWKLQEPQKHAYYNCSSALWEINSDSAECEGRLNNFDGGYHMARSKAFPFLASMVDCMLSVLPPVIATPLNYYPLIYHLMNDNSS